MKLIIDIPEDELTEDEIEEAKRIADDCFSGIKTIPDNATNGDMIKAIFGDKLFGKLEGLMMVSCDWWNAPYQKGNKE